MREKLIVIISIFISMILVAAGLSINQNETSSSETSTTVVREENGTQYIHILAQGGYKPDQITAKGNLPTILEVETNGTYDCSSALTIPKLGYEKFLPPTGITTIEIPKNLTTNSLDILCSMGMFSATIKFS